MSRTPLEQRLIDNKLTEADKQELLGWKKTPEKFLKESVMTQVMDFSSMKNVEEIDDEFLSFCATLKGVNFSPMTKVTKLGNQMMTYCIAITSLDFSAMTEVTSIGFSFLYLCKNLEKLNIGGFTKVTSVGAFFAKDCSKLSKSSHLDQVDLSPLLGIKNESIIVADDEKENNLRTALGRVRIESSGESSSLSERFICNKLTQADKQEILGWKSTPEKFLKGSEMTHALDVSSMTNVEELGDEFLAFSGFSGLDFRPMQKVKKIGNQMMTYCINVVSVDFSALVNVSDIGFSFLYLCKNLEKVNFEGFRSVKTVGAFFCAGCPKLSKSSHLDQCDLSALLNIKDIDIIVAEDEKENNLRAALGRVRAGGANGPKFSASSSSTSSSPTAASQSSSGVASTCENCKQLEAQFAEQRKKLFDKLDCKDMQISKLQREKDGEHEQHQQLLAKQAERLRVLTQENQQLHKQGGGGGGNEVALARAEEKVKALEEKVAALEASLAKSEDRATKAEDRAEKLMTKLLG